METAFSVKPEQTIYGPVLTIQHLRERCERIVERGKPDIHDRHYLNQYALWADAGQILALAAALRG